MTEAAKPVEPQATEPHDGSATRLLKRAGTVLALALVAGLVALLVYRIANQETAKGFVNQVAAGKKPLAPGFSLKPLNGGTPVSLRSLRGHPVVVNFWASWCVPCKQEAPLLQQAYEKWRAKGVVFVGIDGQDFTGDALRFLGAHRIGYLNLSDHQSSSVGRWGVTGFPETFFIDRQGRAVAHIGLQIKDAAELDAAIEKAVA
jgi:cytochrome c biogenesis protein CcmG, thiol:disulfide interchange protein DsbE